MRTISIRCALGVIGILVLGPVNVEAQRASERSKLIQQLAGVDIVMEYFRPVAKGRTPFGGVVHWGEIWTPGANWATTLEVSSDFKLNGHDVPKGKYSVWMVPAQAGEWTVFLDKTAKRFHTIRPKGTAGDALRFKVLPVKAEHMETLTWYLPSINGRSASLLMHWGDTAIPLELSLSAPQTTPLSKAQRALYIGEYVAKADTANQSPAFKFNVFEKGEALRLRMTPGEEEFDPDMDLLIEAEHTFVAASYQKGKLYDLDRETKWIFSVVNGKATAFEISHLGQVYMKAQRVK